MLHNLYLPKSSFLIRGHNLCGAGLVDYKPRHGKMIAYMIYLYIH